MFEDMFSNVGDKIKVVAKIFFVLELIAALIGGIYIMTYGGVYILLGLLTAVAGVLCAWVSALFVFGFGQLITNTDNIKKSTKQTEISIIESKNKLTKTETQKAVKTEDDYKNFNCPVCKAELSYTKDYLMDKDKIVCPMCDAEIKINKK